MHINVVNKRQYNGNGDKAVYIGRPSPLGNKFRVGVDGNREQCIASYYGWLESKIKSEDPVVCQTLNQIVAKMRKHGEVNLVCFCAPKPCHGDVIREIIMKRLRENGEC